MCSIIGVVGENVKSDIINMLHTLKHRGPDGCGVYSRGKIYLNNDILDCEDSSFIIAHNLLSIVGCDELQPFMSENLVLVSNAEIYNYKELISKYDFDLSSNSDCEVILKLIEHNYHDNLKEAILKSIDLLDGDYAFCVSDGKDYVIIDTAGIRKRGKIYENVEKYSIMRAMSAIERSDVVLVVLDGESGLREQDKHVAGYAHEAGKGVILVYNKWDAVEKDAHTMAAIEKKLRTQFLYLSYAPIVFVSALKKQRISQLLPLIDQVHDNSALRIQTNVLNEVIMDAQLMTPPQPHNGKRLKIYYASQVSVCPPTIVLFVNDPELLHFSYKRFLENRLREAFGFEGTTIRILARERS